MDLKHKNIGFCLTGSFYTIKNTIIQMKELVKENANIIPIMSYKAYNLDTKYRKAKEYINEIEEITGNKIIHTIKSAEPIGPKNMTDIMIIAPCTGNTLAKLCLSICDTPVLMASKSHLSYLKPLVIAISTKDGLIRECRKHWKST